MKLIFVCEPKYLDKIMPGIQHRTKLTNVVLTSEALGVENIEEDEEVLSVSTLTLMG